MIGELHPQDLDNLTALLIDERKYPRDLVSLGQRHEEKYLDSLTPEQIKYRRAMAIFEANEIAFHVMKRGLKKRYKSQIEKHGEYYVVIWKGIPFLVGDDRLEVDLEFSKKYGEHPTYIGELGRSKEVVFSSPVV